MFLFILILILSWKIGNYSYCSCSLFFTDSAPPFFVWRQKSFKKLNWKTYLLSLLFNLKHYEFISWFKLYIKLVNNHLNSPLSAFYAHTHTCQFSKLCLWKTWLFIFPLAKIFVFSKIMFFNLKRVPTVFQWLNSKWVIM